MPRNFFALYMIVQAGLRGNCGFVDVCRVMDPFSDSGFTRQIRQNRVLPRKMSLMEIMMKPKLRVIY